MASDDDPHLQTRRKRALLVAGAIGLAAIAWNAGDWWDDDVVTIRHGDEEDVSDIARQVRDEVRDSVRDARDEARGARDDAEADSEELPRITQEGGVLRVESPDGRTVTIQLDNDDAPPAPQAGDDTSDDNN